MDFEVFISEVEKRWIQGTNQSERENQTKWRLRKQKHARKKKHLMWTQPKDVQGCS